MVQSSVATRPPCRSGGRQPRWREWFAQLRKFAGDPTGVSQAGGPGCDHGWGRGAGPGDVLALRPLNRSRLGGDAGPVTWYPSAGEDRDLLRELIFPPAAPQPSPADPTPCLPRAPRVPVGVYPDQPLDGEYWLRSAVEDSRFRGASFVSW